MLLFLQLTSTDLLSMIKIGTGKFRFGQFYYAEQGENHLKNHVCGVN